MAKKAKHMPSTDLDPTQDTTEIFCDSLDFSVAADVEASMQTHVAPFDNWLRTFRKAHAAVATAERDYSAVFDEVRAEFSCSDVKYTADALKAMTNGNSRVLLMQEAIDKAKTDLETLKLARELHKDRLAVLTSLHYSQRRVT
jgi:hypothetical protein